MWKVACFFVDITGYGMGCSFPEIKEYADG
jgi:hypothetical protein